MVREIPYPLGRALADSGGDAAQHEDNPLFKGVFREGWMGNCILQCLTLFSVTSISVTSNGVTLNSALHFAIPVQPSFSENFFKPKTSL